MFRFNKDAAMAGKKVVNGLGERIILQKEAIGWPFPLRDNKFRSYTIHGKLFPDKDDPRDLYMAGVESEENKQNGLETKPEETKTQIEEKADSNTSIQLKGKL